MPATFFGAVVFAAAIFVAPAGADGAIVDIGTLGKTTTANGITPDGTAIGGWSMDNGGAIHAIRWTAADLEDLGVFDGMQAEGRAISADGGVVVGVITGTEWMHGFRCTAAECEDLGLLKDAPRSAHHLAAEDVSDDGSIVVGFGDSDGYHTHAFRWSVAGGLEDLGTFGFKSATARAVSGDGTAITGDVLLPTVAVIHHAFLFAGGAFQDLGTLGGFSSSARAINSNGRVVVGSSWVMPGVTHPFRWTIAGMIDLGTLGGDEASAHAVSDNGVIVAGSSTRADDAWLAFAWSDAMGMADLNEHLPLLGVDLTGWVLESVDGVSADGRRLTGRGLHDGKKRSFLVSLDHPLSRIGDLTGDGAVDGADLGLLLGAWESKGSAADLNFDGTVNGADLELLLGAWKNGAESL